MGKAIIMLIGMGVCVLNIFYGHTDSKIPDEPTPVTSPHHHKTVDEMSETEFKSWLAKQDPKDTSDVVNVPDNVIHYDEATIAALNQAMNGGSGSKAEQTILSGDAVFSGVSNDGIGSTGVTSTAYTGGPVPVGYHVVKAHVTKTGHIVKSHLVRNRTSKKTSVVRLDSTAPSSGVDWSQPIVSRSVDVQQRAAISAQNFPNVAGSISKSDPTVILGTGY